MQRIAQNIWIRIFIWIHLSLEWNFVLYSNKQNMHVISFSFFFNNFIYYRHKILNDPLQSMLFAYCRWWRKLNGSENKLLMFSVVKISARQSLDFFSSASSFPSLFFLIFPSKSIADVMLHLYKHEGKEKNSFPSIYCSFSSWLFGYPLEL